MGPVHDDLDPIMVHDDQELKGGPKNRTPWAMYSQVNVPRNWDSALGESANRTQDSVLGATY